MGVPACGSSYEEKCPNCGADVTVVQTGMTDDAIDACGTCGACGQGLRRSTRIDRQGYLVTEIWAVERFMPPTTKGQ